MRRPGSRRADGSLRTPFWLPFLLLFPALVLVASCSPRRYALNQVADAVAATGGAAQSDDDPQLVKDAAPFNLKLIEALLAENPRHEGLLLAACSGFTQYAYAFVQQDADEAEERDLAAAEALRTRARKLYLRARGYGLRGLEVRHRGFESALRSNPEGTASEAAVEDVPLLYWTAASWGAAIALSKDRPDLVADLPQAEALARRALALDEGYGEGALHVLLIAFEAGRPGSAEAAARCREHFERAVALSRGSLASPYVTYAESVCVPLQDRRQFRSLLENALAIDPDAHPEHRLANLVAQRRARWLLGRTDELFVE
ncbi:MAG: TRAP transporter TatT component family protein [Acidobacteriota bacterium]